MLVHVLVHVLVQRVIRGYFFRLRPATPTSPIKPDPSNMNVFGSGTVVGGTTGGSGSVSTGGDGGVFVVSVGVLVVSGGAELPLCVLPL